jgi:galactarate dehydratase
MTASVTTLSPPAPRYVRVDDNDNVAIVVNNFGLPAGTQFEAGLTLREFVPQGHKVALCDLAEGEAITRYGVTIGYAIKPIARGSWVGESLVRMPKAPSLDNLPMPNGRPQAVEPLTGFSFEGYRNPDGSVGTKNVLAISTSVQCVAARSISPSSAFVRSCCRGIPTSTTSSE